MKKKVNVVKKKRKEKNDWEKEKKIDSEQDGIDR